MINSNKDVTIIIIIFSINTMYSKYLDYSEAAMRAHHVAQAESDQKDVIINSLKGEIFDLKRI